MQWYKDTKRKHAMKITLQSINQLRSMFLNYEFGMSCVGIYQTK